MLLRARTPQNCASLPPECACILVCLQRGKALSPRSDQLRTMLPTYQALLARKALRILVFSGLYDGMEPHLGTELWLSKLNLTLKAPTRPWFDPLVRALDTTRGPLSGLARAWEPLLRSFSSWHCRFSSARAGHVDVVMCCPPGAYHGVQAA